jgi:hypothetical protein
MFWQTLIPSPTYVTLAPITAHDLCNKQSFTQPCYFLCLNFIYNIYIGKKGHYNTCALVYVHMCVYIYFATC